MEEEALFVSSLDELFQQPGYELTYDWDGVAPPFAIQFLLGFSKEEIFFGIRSAEELLGRGAFGEFRSGLWEGDVVELFVHFSASTEYLEINLSPSGAWWAKRFARYRGVGEELPDIDVSLACGLQGEIALSLPRSALDNDRPLFAQAAIVHQPKLHYFVRRFGGKGSSIARDELQANPDFHQRALAEHFVLP